MVDIATIHLEKDVILKKSLRRDMALESEEEDIEEKPQLVVSTINALFGYANPQTMKIDGFLKHQPITILVDIGSTHNFMDSMVAS
ncbi:hypothetical protein GW17_00016931 [Ensete ventricosum]|nr:hypothetical protein GW17_00016931 [Ensete ventricosum]